MNHKKGSHVGFVISFVLFVAFVFFMYALLSSRINLGQNKQSSLENVKSEVIKRVSGNLTTTSVKVNQAASQSCFHFSGLLNKISAGQNFIVQNYSGNIFTSYISSDGDIYVSRSGDTISTLFEIYSSGEFPPAATSGPIGCVDLSEGTGYTIGLSKTESNVFASEIFNLFGNYTQNYSGLKKDIKIPSGDEFGLIFTYSNGTEIKTPMRNITLNVYASRIPIQYIKSDATSESGFINALVW